MGKLVFVFLAVCFISTFSISDSLDLGHGLSHGLSHGLGHGFDLGHSHGKYLSHGKHHHQSHYVHGDIHDDHTEVYVALAQGAFDFFAKLVRAKIEIILFLKKAIIPLLVKGFAHLRHLMIHNADFVHGIITIIGDLMKSLLTDKPHVGVSHVNKLISTAAHEILGFGLGHY